MASASTPTTQSGVRSLGQRAQMDTLALPGLLQCVVLSYGEQRGQFLRTASADESWQAQVCEDVQEFLRSVFQLNVPLTVIDLPPRGAASYAELREIATQISDINRSLLLVCGAENDQEEEIWARQLGAWAYLPGTTDANGLRRVFAEARKALARQASAYVEVPGYR